ncbi:CPBP family intramembrane glutamic endopeptidase [Flavobacterium litorale]|uniref:CPBP family intramembrane metalloprotease n=1 Tax=Flavobacterium litorale TaxID=2856519 RepID=A0ABX8VEA3_9FLAO|nr:CPBP family intramembrane glutamic endopeptidase [Flavobacterium litorale]QYJ68979.1 CPBP family intramembrane metalloprotease [Flavobacterium litorale]
MPIEQKGDANGLIKPANRLGVLFDLTIYISTMFLIRELYFPEVGFIINGLFWSLSTLIIATWRMKARNVSWKDLGLRKPESIKKTLLTSAGILAATILSILFFQIVKDYLPFSFESNNYSENSTSKFGELKGNWLLFFAIMPAVSLESMLEELLDRGFLINWFEKFFSQISIATILAVVLQAAIFGFRHSYDLSERSITVGIIGLVMGIAYVKFGRNLWALIIAHCILNTMSMIDRVQ